LFASEEQGLAEPVLTRGMGSRAPVPMAAQSLRSEEGEVRELGHLPEAGFEKIELLSPTSQGTLEERKKGYSGLEQV